MLSLPWRRSARKTAPARITAAALLGSAATVAALVATDVVPVPSWALSGVDVASHQHPGDSAIDWQQVKANGQSFAFIKATEGTGYTNPYFSGDSIKAKEAGITPGSYHYARPGQNDPRSEARFYAATLATGAQPSLPPVLDLEEDEGLSPTQLQNWTREWIDEIKTLTGRDPIIYTYKWFWENRMANTTEFNKYPLWLAYYSDTLPDEAIPGGWKYVTFWQKADKSSVDGIVGPVDMNEYFGDDAQLKAMSEDLPSGTVAGDTADALEPVRQVAGAEANVANEIEHATGVDVPMASDFFMVLLGVIGGRLPAEALLTQGATEIENANAANGGDGGDVSRATAAAQNILRAYTALAGALEEFNANGNKIPVDQLTAALSQQKAAGADGSASTVNVSQVLSLLQQFGGVSDWNAKLRNGEVQPDPDALKKLDEAAKAAYTVEQGGAASSTASEAPAAAAPAAPATPAQ